MWYRQVETKIWSHALSFS